MSPVTFTLRLAFVTSLLATSVLQEVTASGSNFNNSTSCDNSAARLNLVSAGGDKIPFLCRWVEKGKSVDCKQPGTLASHCPGACKACNMYGCANSLGTFTWKNKEIDCNWLATKSEERIFDLCQKPKFSTTCRETCNVCTTARCTREVYSVLDPNPSWTDHPFHTQVWYHTLEDIHSLWREGYFDYVLDIRPLQDFTIDNGGEDLLLEGWETFHIPGSYPVNMFPPSTPASEVEMLIDFDSSNLCKDARIFVHCWSGISGNMVAKTLIELGFTNIHAAGPQGSAGIWDWKAAGYDIVMNDSFNAEESRFQPSCIDMCEA